MGVCLALHANAVLQDLAQHGFASGVQTDQVDRAAHGLGQFDTGMRFQCAGDERDVGVLHGAARAAGNRDDQPRDLTACIGAGTPAPR